MCLDRMKELLTNPVAAIAKAKKKKDIEKTLIILIVEWILIGLTVFVALRKIKVVPQLASVSIGIPLFGIVVSLICGSLIQIVFNILGGKGKYFEGLTPIVYATLPISVGLFVGSILTLVPTIGLLLAGIVVLVFALIGISTLYRAVKELFRVDLITAWIGISILIMGATLAFYVLFASMLTEQQLLSLIMTKKFG